MVKLASGGELPYDRLILVAWYGFHVGCPARHACRRCAQEKVLHAWKAGAQTMSLRQQLEAMPDGGVYALVDPARPLTAARPGPMSALARLPATSPKPNPSPRC
jgi:sulfide dehydrogenase [flavocytochrome c] flavoprotein subunit